MISRVNFSGVIKIKLTFLSCIYSCIFFVGLLFQVSNFITPNLATIIGAGDDGAVRVRWSCGQGGGSGVEYIVLKQVMLAETLC